MGDIFEPEVLDIKTASISDCGLFRYRLTRIWGRGYSLPFVMLNPSTADANVDDPTIRRCKAFAHREGYGGITVANLCAFRSPSPADLDKASDPFGPFNNEVLRCVGLEASAFGIPIVCAWGVHGAHRGAEAAIGLFRSNGVKMVCLGVTSGNHPRHPLYVKGDQPLIPFRASVGNAREPNR